MLKPEEIDVYPATPREESVFRCVEDHIDFLLKKNLGIAEVPMVGTVPNKMCDPIQQRHWAEVARRYATAGWDVAVEEDAQNLRLIITHPKLRFPEPSESK
jgi:hypothetical protein